MRLRSACVFVVLLVAAESFAAPTTCVVLPSPRVKVIHGFVEDPTGVRVQGAKVELRHGNVELRQGRGHEGKLLAKTETDAKGMFRLPQVPVGDYYVLVAAEGFGKTGSAIKVTQFRSEQIGLKVQMDFLGCSAITAARVKD